MSLWTSKIDLTDKDALPPHLETTQQTFFELGHDHKRRHLPETLNPVPRIAPPAQYDPESHTLSLHITNFLRSHSIGGASSPPLEVHLPPFGALPLSVHNILKPDTDDQGEEDSTQVTVSLPLPSTLYEHFASSAHSLHHDSNHQSSSLSVDYMDASMDFARRQLEQEIANASATEAVKRALEAATAAASVAATADAHPSSSSSSGAHPDISLAAGLDGPSGPYGAPVLEQENVASLPFAHEDDEEGPVPFFSLPSSLALGCKDLPLLPLVIVRKNIGFVSVASPYTS